MKTCPCSATLRFAVPILFLAAVAADSATSQVVVGLGGGTPGTSQNFTVVGHNPLFNRGMNAALAIFDHFVYIGNRSDGSNSCGDLNGTGPIAPVLTPTNPDGTCTHTRPGIDRKSTRLNSSHGYISYAVFCLKKKKRRTNTTITSFVVELSV